MAVMTEILWSANLIYNYLSTAVCNALKELRTEVEELEAEVNTKLTDRMYSCRKRAGYDFKRT